MSKVHGTRYVMDAETTAPLTQRISRIINHQHASFGLPPPSSLDPAVLEYFTSFSQCLEQSNNILALVGAGLSRSSGIPYYRDSGRLWNGHESRVLSTPGVFSKDPVLSWSFHQDRRSVATNAEPNRGHVALAELARRKPRFLTINQNIDGLSQRAGHPQSNLVNIHGSLFTLVCVSVECGYQQHDDFTEAIPSIPAISPLDDIPHIASPRTNVSIDQLPHCPRCKTKLLRPSIVWFGEPLADEDVKRIDTWFDEAVNVDLMLVIGTSACVTPAAEYIDRARERGARVAVFNSDRDENQLQWLQKEDWVFLGDAAVILPELVQVVTG